MTNSDSDHILSLTSVGRGAVFYTGGKFASQIFGFLAVVLLTNTLGAERYGIYALGTTIIALAGSLANLGSDKAILRFLPAQSTQQSSYWSFSVLVSAIGGAAASILLFVFAPIINELTLSHPLFTTTLRVLTLFLLANIGLEMSRSAFRALDRPDLNTAIHQLLYPGLKVCLFAFLVGVTASYISFLYGLIAVTVLAAGLGGIILVVKTPIKPTSPTGVDVQEYLDFSLPSAVKDVGSLLYTRVDILMIGAFATASGIGVYRVAIVIGTVVAIPLSGVNQIFPAIASKLHSEGNDIDLERVYRSVTRWAVTLSLPVVLSVLVYQREVLAIMGGDFTGGTLILSILLVGQFVNTSVGPSGYLLMMTNHHRLLTLNQWGFGLLNVLLNYLLINQLGILGAAIATTITLIALNITRLVEVVLLEGWFPYTRALVKPVTAAIAMTTVLVTVKYHIDGLIGLIAGVSVGVLTFFAILYLIGVPETDRLVYDKMKGQT